MLAIPPALLLVGTALVVVANPGAAALNLLAPTLATLFLIALAVDAIWRVVAIADSVRESAVEPAGIVAVAGHSVPLPV